MTNWDAYDCRRTTRSCRGGRARAGRRYVPAVLKEVLDPANLWAVLQKMSARNGQAPGVDGVRHHDLSKGEWFELFREVRKAILAGTYRPQPLRQVNIPKPDGGTRTLKLAAVIDRVIENALADATTPAAENIFLDCSFGFRPGRDRFGMLAVLKSWCETHGLWVITADDVKKAFDHVPVAAAVTALRRLGIDPALINLAVIFLRGHEQREVGIAQGGALSPLMLNLLLHYTLDLPMTARGGHEPVRYLRYADNLVAPTRTKEEGRDALERMRDLLAGVELQLKGAPGTPRDPSQGEHLDLLGLRLTRTGDTLTFEIPDTKWDDLKTKLAEAHTETNPTGAARSLVTGWIQAHAPAFDTNDRRTHNETVSRLINLLWNTGHDHALTHTQIPRTILTIAEKWERVVSEARNRMTPGPTTPSTTTGATTQSNAVTPDEAHQESDGHTAQSPHDAPAQLKMGGASRGGPVGVSGSTSTSSRSFSSSPSTSPSRTPFRPSGRSTALPGCSAAPPSAHHPRTRTSKAADTRSRTHRPRHCPGGRPMRARPPPRPP